MQKPYISICKAVCLSESWLGSNSQNQKWNNGLVQIGKGAYQGCLLSPCLFNLYAQYIMQIPGWMTQAEIKISRRNIKNLRYAEEATLMAESKKELKRFQMRVKQESEKACLKLNIQKKQDHDIQSHHFITNRRGKSGNTDRFNFLRLKNHCRW